MIKTDRLILQRPAMTDVNTYFEIYGDPQTNLFNPFGPVPDTIAATANMTKFLTHWDTYGFGVWKISTIADPHTVIGYGGLSHKMYDTNDRINLGYRFGVNAWGKGYATELCLAAVRYGFEQLALQEIWAVVRPDNLPSIHVLEKAGLSLAGTLNDVPGQQQSLLYNILP